MTLIPESRGAAVGWKPALLSILAFWLFYFAVATARSYVMPFGDQLHMAGLRLVVGAIGILITFALYRVLRRTAGLSLRWALAIAAVACLPAAIAYSTANWYVFDNYLGTTRGRLIMQWPDKDRAPTVLVGRADKELKLTPTQMIADNAMSGYFFMMAWAAFYFALSYAAAVRRAERRAADYRAAAQSAELRALRYQVSPHFLFNTLNSLSSLVLQDQRDEAERMIQNLATFFRTSLTAEPTADVTLHQEIALQRLYLAIETVRFRDRLRVTVDVPAPLEDACVPGLLLQPLVENAIKYGVSRARRPVTIAIAATQDARGLVLTVADDGDPIPAHEADGHRGTGVGLENVSQRLAARFGAQASCAYGSREDGSGYAVTLTLPLVRNGC